LIGDNGDPWGSDQCVDVGFDDCHAYEDCDECAGVGCFWQTSQLWTDEGICAYECLIADMDCYGNAEDWIAECPEVTGCVDLSGLDFGECDMVLGIGYIDGECQYISGCDWLVDYTDYNQIYIDILHQYTLSLKPYRIHQNLIQINQHSLLLQDILQSNPLHSHNSPYPLLNTHMRKCLHLSKVG
jgi:hypothetical protein